MCADILVRSQPRLWHGLSVGGTSLPAQGTASLPQGPQPNASELQPAAGCSVQGLPYLDVFFLELETWRMRKGRDA